MPWKPFQNIPYPNAGRDAKQRNDDIAKSGTTANTTVTLMDRARKERKERQARKAKLKAKHRGTKKTDRSITVEPRKEPRRNPDRPGRNKQRDDNVAGSNVSVMPENEPPRSPEQQAEQRNDNVPFVFTSSVKMFDELPPPGQDEPKTWAWRLRMLVLRRLTLGRTEYCKIDWKREIDLQKFQRDCVECNPCYLHWYRGKWPVPFACPKHSLGTELMWRRRDEEFREQWDAHIAAEEERREAAWVEEEKRIERAFAANPDLWLRDMLWEAEGPGVALITGTLLKAVATFFCDCEITVEEANLETMNRRYKKEGRDIVAQLQSEREEITWSAQWRAQVRISITKFRQPGHVRNPEHPGHAAVRNPKGRYGNTLCALIFFLGMTGRPGPEKIDNNCSYWFYSASGFSGPDISKIGQKGPFRMVRLSNVSHRDHNDFMMRFDLKTGTKRAKAFSDGFNSKVKRMGVTSLRWEDFRHWDDLPGEPMGYFEDDDPGEDDLGEEDPGEDNFFEDIFGEDSSGEDDTVEEDPVEAAPVEDAPVEDAPSEEDPPENGPSEDGGNVEAQESDSDVSELTDYGYQFDEDGDDSDNGLQWPIPGKKSCIPRHLRAGAKVKRWLN